MIGTAQSKSNNTHKTLTGEAEEYAARGWTVIPVSGKKPAIAWKQFQKQPADNGTLHRMFGKPNITGLAVITGTVSGGLAVRDFDVADSYHRWADANIDTNFPTVQTARGYHIYGYLPHEHFADLGDGELRADSRHYVVLPPSQHPDGVAYRWLNPLPPVGKALPPLPSSLTQPSKPSNHIACVSLPNDSEIGQAILATLPTGPGQRNGKIFKLVQRLKGILPKAKADDLRPIVKEWFALALPFIRTTDFVETWSDFAVAWQRCLYAAGGSIKTANAIAASVVLKGQAASYQGAVRKLAAMCAGLQTQAGNRPFFLSCRTAAKEAGLSPMQAWRYLNVLQFDGVLKAVRKGSKASKMASEWRFVLDHRGEKQHECDCAKTP